MSIKNILISTPLQSEYNALLSALATISSNIYLDNNEAKIEVNGALIRIMVGGRGKSLFGISITHQLATYSLPDLVMCVGAAGSLNDKLQIGDIVVAEKTVEYDFLSKFDGTLSFPFFPGSAKNLSRLKAIRNITDLHGFNIYFGGIASGDEDITSDARAREIALRLRSYGIPLAVAWEGAGGARACSFMDVPFLEIRGITGKATSNSTSRFNEKLKIIMTNFTNVLNKLLT